MIDTTDSLIFIAQKESQDILKTWKHIMHCNRSIKDDLPNVIIVVSLENFDIILLFVSYLSTIWKV